MKRLGIFILPLVLAANSEAAWSTHTAEELGSVFLEGFSAQASATSRSSSTLSYYTAQLQLGYGFPGITVSASLPVVLTDTSNTAGGAGTPRIGGGLFSRPEVDSYFRLIGNLRSYLSFGFGFGLPIQSDQVLQQSTINTFLTAPALLARVGSGILAIELKVIDEISWPNVFRANGLNVYLDPKQTVLGILQLYVYPLPWLGGYAGLGQLSGSSLDFDVDFSGTGMILAKAGSGPITVALFGVQGAIPGVPALVQLETQYLINNPSTVFPPYSFSGSLKWSF